MKYLIAFIILSFSNYLKSQDTNNLLFDFNQDIKFEHYNDHWVTREIIHVDGRHIIDTVYSCEYDNYGKKLRERISKNGHLQNGIRVFRYNELELKTEELFYEEREIGDEFANVSAELRRFIYNTQNHLTKIVGSVCFKPVKESTQKRRDSLISNPTEGSFESWIESPSDYSDYWVCNENTIKIDYTLNDDGLPIHSYVFVGESPENKTSYTYIKNELVKLVYCQFGYKGIEGFVAGSLLTVRDTSKCNWTYIETYKYTDSTLTVIKNDNMLGNDISVQTDSIFDHEKRIKKVIEHTHQKWFENNIEKKREYKAETLFYYDKLGRISKKEEYSDEEDKPTIYRYFYK